MTPTPSRDEMLARLAKLRAANEATTSWGAAVGARSEEIRNLERSLAVSASDGVQGRIPDGQQCNEQSGKGLSRATGGDPCDIVGWKTFATGERDEDGFEKHRREPLTRSEGDAIWAAAEAAKADRIKRMPDEKAAISALFDAWQRLKDFKWNDPIYCPKDGSPFNVLELGSTGIHTAHYSGTWPDGHWWVADDHDLWPSRPALFKLLPEDQAKHDAKMQEGAERFRAAMASGKFDAPPEDVAETDANAPDDARLVSGASSDPTSQPPESGER